MNRSEIRVHLHAYGRDDSTELIRENCGAVVCHHPNFSRRSRIRTSQLVTSRSWT